MGLDSGGAQNLGTVKGGGEPLQCLRGDLKPCSSLFGRQLVANTVATFIDKKIRNDSGGIH